MRGSGWAWMGRFPEISFFLLYTCKVVPAVFCAGEFIYRLQFFGFFDCVVRVII